MSNSEPSCDDVLQAQLQHFSDQMRAATGLSMCIALAEQANKQALQMAVSTRNVETEGDKKRFQADLAYNMIAVAGSLLNQLTDGNIELCVRHEGGIHPVGPSVAKVVEIVDGG